MAKAGNRSVSSACGSADVLEALGVKVDLSPSAVEKCVDKTGIGEEHKATERSEAECSEDVKPD